jgi:hypothetical protein
MVKMVWVEAAVRIVHRGSPLLGSCPTADSDVAVNIDSNGTTIIKRAGLFMTDAFLRYP